MFVVNLHPKGAIPPLLDSIRSILRRIGNADGKKESGESEKCGDDLTTAYTNAVMAACSPEIHFPLSHGESLSLLCGCI